MDKIPAESTTAAAKSQASQAQPSRKTQEIPVSSTIQMKAAIYCEGDRVIFSDELAAAEKANPSKLADAIPASDSVTWGAREALRTLEEAIVLARLPMWHEWSTDARAFRWHYAGRAEMDL